MIQYSHESVVKVPYKGTEFVVRMARATMPDSLDDLRFYGWQVESMEPWPLTGKVDIARLACCAATPKTIKQKRATGYDIPFISVSRETARKIDEWIIRNIGVGRHYPGEWESIYTHENGCNRLWALGALTSSEIVSDRLGERTEPHYLTEAGIARLVKLQGLKD